MTAEIPTEGTSRIPSGWPSAGGRGFWATARAFPAPPSRPPSTCRGASPATLTWIGSVAPAPGAGATEPIQVSVAGEAPRQVDGGRDGGAGKARAVAQKPRPPADGQPLGILEVPSVGISAVILEGIAGQTLLTGPGHLPWTALPGSNDVSVVAG